VSEQGESRRTLSGLLGRWRWQLATPRFILAVALANAAIYHVPLFAFALGNLDMASANGALTVATLFVLAIVVTSLILGLLALVSEPLLKPLCMVLAVGSAVAVYFVHTYGVILDVTMMGNVFNTDSGEVAGLLHPKLAVYVALLGGVPCWLLSRVTVVRTPLLQRLRFLGIVLVTGVAWGYANSRTWLWIDKNAKRLGGMTMPWSYVINAPRYLVKNAKPREQKLLPPATFAAGAKGGKTVVMLVIGEAARAQNFSLYGYPRPTNPELAAAHVAVLPNARSCSTYTTASLVCILSHLDSALASLWEPLPSYLQRSGVDVVWRTHNWGEPPMRVATFERAGELRRGCQGEGCEFDEVLLNGLDRRIRDSKSDRVFVVLHLQGSHGPAYNTKYPARFETFKPVCKSVELSQCTSGELVNAYDNTIVYADHVVAEAIGLLQAFTQDSTVLLFLSDHGESLGEYGLYLHGTPYSIAPDVQKEIPFLVWMSDAFRKKKAIAPERLGKDARTTQANVFHSVMGAFGMRSDVYQPDLDIFKEVTP
jgi:lipid A ethanolaminephosphotransferase